MIRKILHILTKERVEFRDITQDTRNCIQENHIKNGIITIRTLHTTSSIYINEGESGLLKDITAFLAKTIPDDSFYHHDDFSVRKIREIGFIVSVFQKPAKHLGAYRRSLLCV